LSDIIQAENLRKTYRVGKVDVHALRGVDLNVEAGEFVSIVGPSGCGKSSLLHILGGLTAPSEGRVTVDGEDLLAMAEGQRTEMRKKKIGFVFQRFNLLPTLTAYDNIALASHIAGHGESFDKAHLDAILKLLGIDQRVKHRPLEMSGGEQQRVAIARAVVNKPKILLADEPTGALDTETSNIVLNMLHELNEKFGQTILMITHNPEVAGFSDRIITMRDGHVIDDGRDE
jgi:putative ABC transport system ATP-binding protein